MTTIKMYFDITSFNIMFSLLSNVCIAKQQATELSINYLDMLLHAQQVMPPNGYICDV